MGIPCLEVVVPLGLRLLVLALLVLTFSVNAAAGIIALTVGYVYAVEQRVQRQRVPADLES